MRLRLVFEILTTFKVFVSDYTLRKYLLEDNLTQYSMNILYLYAFPRSFKRIFDYESYFDSGFMSFYYTSAVSNNTFHILLKYFQWTFQRYFRWIYEIIFQLCFCIAFFVVELLSLKQISSQRWNNHQPFGAEIWK